MPARVHKEGSTNQKQTWIQTAYLVSLASQKTTNIELQAKLSVVDQKKMGTWPNVQTVARKCSSRGVFFAMIDLHKVTRLGIFGPAPQAAPHGWACQQRGCPGEVVPWIDEKQNQNIQNYDKCGSNHGIYLTINTYMYNIYIWCVFENNDHILKNNRLLLIDRNWCIQYFFNLILTNSNIVRPNIVSDSVVWLGGPWGQIFFIPALSSTRELNAWDVAAMALHDPKFMCLI